MGIRGELFSTRITTEGRTYFFNVKQNRMGDVFLTIVESKPTETENFDRRSIVVFQDDMRGFLKAFQGALKFMEKPGAPQATPNFTPEDSEGFQALMASRSKAKDGKDTKEPKPKAQAKDGAETKRRVVVKRKASGDSSSKTGKA